MNLNRDQAIAEHRKMWRWIAEEIEKRKVVLSIYDLKIYFVGKHYAESVRNHCFLCEYTYAKCEKCPLDWGIVEEGFPCEGEACSDDDEKYGLWWKCNQAKTWQEQAALPARSQSFRKGRMYERIIQSQEQENG